MLYLGMARPEEPIANYAGDWLIKQFTIWNATFQNWMAVALAMILVAIILAWATRR